MKQLSVRERMWGSLLGVAAGGLCAGGAWAQGWEPAGLAGGGAMYAIAASPHDPKTMMLSCDMSGAYVTRDGGSTWQMIHHRSLPGYTLAAPVFDPVRPGVIYAVAGWSGAIRESADNGKTWKELVSKPPWSGRVRGMRAAGGDGVFWVGTETELWMGRSGGRQWSRCEGVTGEYLGMCAVRQRPGTYVAATDQGVFRSDDGGKRFQKVGGGLPARELVSFAGGSDARITRLYAAVETGEAGGALTGGVFASDDLGATWRRAMNKDLNVETQRSSEWANGDIARYAYLLCTDVAPERVYVYCAGTSYFPPNHSTVYRSDDAGRSWRAVLFSDPRFKGQYNMEDDRLTLAIGQRYQEEPHAMAINPGNPEHVMMTTSMFVFFTADGGRSWRVSHGGTPVKAGKVFSWPCNGLVVTSTWNYYADPHDPRRHYICYTDIGFARSLDSGRTWIWEGHRLPWRNTTYELAFDPEVKGRIWGAFSNAHDIPNYNIIGGRHRVIPEGGVAMSADHGETWKKVGGAGGATDLPEAPCVSVVLDPRSSRDRRTLYAALFEKGVFRSADGGVTWQAKSKGLGSAANRRSCRLILHRDGTLFNLVTAKRTGENAYEAEGPGVYRSSDGGETWTKINASQIWRWPKDFAVHPEDSKVVLVGVGNLRGHPEAGLYRTTDGGKKWEKLAVRGSEHFGATFHPQRKGWIYMTLCEGAEESGLYLSRDNGKTWSPFLDLPFANIQRVHFVPGDDRTIVVTTFGGSVFRGPAAPSGP